MILHRGSPNFEKFSSSQPAATPIPAGSVGSAGRRFSAAVCGSGIRIPSFQGFQVTLQIAAGDFSCGITELGCMPAITGRVAWPNPGISVNL